MKLSNKILIGLVGFVFIYVTAAFTEIRFRGENYRIDETNGLVETVEIPELGYVILPDLNKRIKVAGSDNPRIEVRSLSGDLLKNLKYTVSGDTLELASLELEENQRIRITIYVPHQNLRGIKTNGTAVIVEDLRQDTISIIQNSGWIRLQNNNVLSKLNIKVLNDGYFNLSDTELKTLSVNIDHSEVRIISPVERLEGSISNESYLQVSGTDDIDFRKDKSSQLYLN